MMSQLPGGHQPQLNVRVAVQACCRRLIPAAIGAARAWLRRRELAVPGVTAGLLWAWLQLAFLGLYLGQLSSQASGLSLGGLEPPGQYSPPVCGLARRRRGREEDSAEHGRQHGFPLRGPEARKRIMAPLVVQLVLGAGRASPPPSGQQPGNGLCSGAGLWPARPQAQGQRVAVPAGGRLAF